MGSSGVPAPLHLMVGWPPRPGLLYIKSTCYDKTSKGGAFFAQPWPLQPWLMQPVEPYLAGVAPGPAPFLVFRLREARPMEIARLYDVPMSLIETRSKWRSIQTD